MTTAPALLLLLAASLAGWDAPADTVPLFASDEPVVLTLIADFQAIRGDPDEDPRDRPARAVLDGGDTLDVELRPRGHFRRDPAFCSFPPLRLDVPDEGMEGTVFRDQDKLKLVVSCRPNRDSYEAYVLREYLLYKVYAALTPLSFNVRLARVTFVDSSGDMEPFTRYSFFIEDDGALAARLGAQLLDIPEGKIVRAGLLHPDLATRVAIFQYMIGNTDWADARVQNVALVGVDGRVAPVPYDFDHAGAVNAVYARPQPGAPLANVRQRFYQGWCWPNQDEEAAVRPFKDARPAIDALVADFAYLGREDRADVTAYLAEFFHVVETPERAHQRMFRDCRRP
jgi:hypothetical protein